MANLERTAYPRFPRVITTRDLLRHYTPDVDEVEWASGFARSDTGRLGLIVLLKTFQQLNYFPALENVTAEINKTGSAQVKERDVQKVESSGVCGTSKKKKIRN